MKWLKFVAKSIAGTAVGLYLFYLWAMPVYSYRFRVTVEVDVDGQVKSGDGIIESSVQYVGWLPVKGEWDGWSTGEAPVVDLGKHGKLVATFEPFAPYQCDPIPSGLFAAPYSIVDPRKKGKAFISAFKSIQKTKGRNVVDRAYFPQFVWLPEPSDRGSARIVCLEKMVTTIGAGAQVKGVYVEITADRPDGSIFVKLPWLNALKSEQTQSSYRPPDYNFHLNATDLLGDL